MLVTCPECGAKISNSAYRCPKCGKTDAGICSKESCASYAQTLKGGRVSGVIYSQYPVELIFSRTEVVQCGNEYRVNAYINCPICSLEIGPVVASGVKGLFVFYRYGNPYDRHYEKEHSGKKHLTDNKR